MANYNLTGQKIKNTYGQVAQVNDSNELVDGLGNSKQIVTSSIVNFSTEVSRSAAEAGFGAGGGSIDTSSLVQNSTFNAYTSSNDSAVSVLDTRVDSLTAATSSYLTSLPSGVVSSSAQVDLSQATGVAVSASHAITASYALNAGGDTEWDTIQNKPSGLVSGSSQVSYNGITDVPSGIVSGAAQLPQIATNTSDIASLTSATSSYLTSLPSGVVSGSSQIDLSQATGTAANATSASYAVTASHIPGLAGAGLVAGAGTDSMRSSDDLTTTGATAAGDSAISLGNGTDVNGNGGLAIGNGATVGGNDGIAIGTAAGEAGGQDSTIAIGLRAHFGDSYGIGIGRDSVGGYFGVAVGDEANASNNGIAIGAGAQTNNSNEINIGDTFQYNNDGNSEIKLNGGVRVPTSTLTITSNTASVDGAASNFFSLANAGGSNLVANPTNIQDGSSYVFKITNGANLTWGSTYKFEGGVAPTLSAGTDIVTFVSIGGSELYGTYLSNLS